MVTMKNEPLGLYIERSLSKEWNWECGIELLHKYRDRNDFYMLKSLFKMSRNFAIIVVQLKELCFLFLSMLYIFSIFDSKF